MVALTKDVKTDYNNVFKYIINCSASKKDVHRGVKWNSMLLKADRLYMAK